MTSFRSRYFKMNQRQTTSQNEVFSDAIVTRWALSLLILLLLLLLVALPAKATDYIFSSMGPLPTSCSLNLSSTTSYTCGVVTLAVGDTITVGTFTPVTVTFTGAFTTAAGNLINTVGATSDLNIVTNGVLTLGADTILNANVTGTAAINLGAGSTIGGNITASTTTGVVTLGVNSTVGGFIHTDAGAVNVGSSSTIGGGITTQAGVVTLLTNINVGGDISTDAGAITIGSGSSTCGNVFSTGAGIVTITTDIQVGGDVKTVAGAITIGIGSTVGGDVNPTGAGVVTLTGVHVGGKVETSAGAITLTNSRVRGTVVATGAGVVTLTNSVINDTSLVVPVPPGCSVAAVIHHYEISHDGQGLTCEAETLIIKVCTDESCSSLSTETVSLDVIADGTIISSPTFTGTTTISSPSSSTVSFNHTVVETLTFSVANATIAASNATVCDNDGSASCDMAFTDAGFRFLYGNSTTILNQTSGTPFGDTLKLQAVKDIDGVCTGLFTNDIEVDLSQENVAPGGTSGLNFTVNGSPIAKHSSVTNTTLNFGANSIAIIPTPIYHDAGEIRLHANYDVGGVTLTGSSNSFWVSPAVLAVSAKSGATHLNSASATETPTHKAGVDFNLTVTALNSLGVITPNYFPGQIQFKLERTGPTLADKSVDGYLTYTATSTSPLATSTSPIFQDVTLTNFSSGVSSYNAAHYSEVGLLKLEVQDSNYGSSSIVISATAINIGRFIPDHFKQTVVRNGDLYATCDTRVSFTAYSGQKDEATSSIGAISYLHNPILAITAYNKQHGITQNYYEDSQGSVNDFMKLSNTDVVVITPTLDKNKEGVDTNKLSLTANIHTGTLSQNDLTVLPSVVALPNGVLHYQLSDSDNFFYNRSANALVEPFTSAIHISTATIKDADDVDLIPAVPIVGAPTTVDALPTGIEIRFARLRLENSFGPETSNLPQPMQLEHFDGTGFVVSSDNNCVSYDASKTSLTNISLDPSFTEILGGTGVFFNGKTRVIELKAPGASNQGEIDVSYDTYDWLKYDWDNDGAYDNPSATATFGLFRGNDRIIYRREVYR
jgi:hypothetical protein